MILRAILAAIVVAAALRYYCDMDGVPAFCVAMVATSLAAQVFLVRKGNLIPFFRAWLIGGFFAAFAYQLDVFKTDAYDIPTGKSYVAAFAGCLFAGIWSVIEGRSVWTGKREPGVPNDQKNGG